jgi:hypothetical protein
VGVAVLAAAAADGGAVITPAAGDHHDQAGENRGCQQSGDEIAGDHSPARGRLVALLSGQPLGAKSLLFLLTARHRVRESSEAGSTAA